MKPQKSFIVELNEAARGCSNLEYAQGLRLSATRLHGALEQLAKTPTRDVMQDVVSAWTRAYFALTHMPPEADPDAPLSGAPEIARLAA